jgi:hypothetical protein
MKSKEKENAENTRKMQRMLDVSISCSEDNDSDDGSLETEPDLSLDGRSAQAKKGSSQSVARAGNAPRSSTQKTDESDQDSKSLARQVVTSIKPLCTGKGDRPTKTDVKRLDFMMRQA